MSFAVVDLGRRYHAAVVGHYLPFALAFHPDVGAAELDVADA